MSVDKTPGAGQEVKKWFDENYRDPILSEEEHAELCNDVIEYVLGEAMSSIASTILRQGEHRVHGLRASHVALLGQLANRATESYKSICERAVKSVRDYILQRVMTEANSEKYGAMTILKHYQIISKGDPSLYPEFKEPYENHPEGVCEFLEFASQHFRIDEKGKIHYPGAAAPRWVYGGPRWADVAQAGLELWRATSDGKSKYESGKVQVLMHTALQQMHNRGMIFGGRIRGFLDLAGSESLENLVSNIDKFTSNQRVLDRWSRWGTEWQALEAVVRGSAGIPTVDKIYRAQMTKSHKDFVDENDD